MRREDDFHAFNNACPHLHLPLFEPRPPVDGDSVEDPRTGEIVPLCSNFTEDRGVVCRWHASCFDLQTGEIREWAPWLQKDGSPEGWEFLGDISKNRAKLKVYPCRVEDGDLWIALE